MGAATLLHLAAGLFLLTFVRLPSTPAAPGDQAVALIFAPAPMPQVVPPPVPMVTAAPPLAPPKPPAPPTPSSPTAVPPPPPNAASPPDVPPPPEIPPAPPATAALAPPPVPLPPHPPRHPPPNRQPARPPRLATARPSHTSPPEPQRQAAPPAPPSAAAADVAETAAALPAQPAPIATDWQHALFDWLAAHKTYPDAARRRGEQGRVVLRFTVDRSGKVLAVELQTGSGSPLLDDAAQAMLRNAALPSFPAEMPQERVTITVQIRYRLTD